MKSRSISTTCLFHYTKSYDTLRGILTSGLRYSRVREVLPQIGWGTDPLTALGIQRTYTDNKVVCFCDLDGRDKVGQKWSFKNGPPG